MACSSTTVVQYGVARSTSALNCSVLALCLLTSGAIEPRTINTSSGGSGPRERVGLSGTLYRGVDTAIEILRISNSPETIDYENQ